MPHNCCVPGCTSNKKSKQNNNNSYVTVYKFPKDNSLLEKWQKLIPRQNFVVTEHSVVCVKHFEKDCILTSYSYKITSGETKVFQYDRPKLKPGSCPTLFPNVQQYLRKPKAVKRKIPEQLDFEVTKLKKAKVENSKKNSSTSEVKKEACVGKFSAASQSSATGTASSSNVEIMTPIKIEVKTLDEINDSFDLKYEEEGKISTEPMEVSKDTPLNVNADEEENYFNIPYSEHDFEEEEDPLSIEPVTTDNSNNSSKSQISDVSFLSTSTISEPDTGKKLTASTRKRRKTTAENKENYSKRKSKATDVAVDDDKEFLLSLLPAMKELNPLQKSEFKSNVLKELNRIRFPKSVSPVVSAKLSNSATQSGMSAPTSSQTIITLLPYTIPVHNTSPSNVKHVTSTQPSISTSSSIPQISNIQNVQSQQTMFKLPMTGPLNLINIPKELLGSALQKTTASSGSVVTPTKVVTVSKPISINLAKDGNQIPKTNTSAMSTNDENLETLIIDDMRRRLGSITGRGQDSGQQLQILGGKNSSSEEELLSDITFDEIKIEPLKIEPLDPIDEDE